MWIKTVAIHGMVLRSYNTVVMITFVASKYKSRAYFRYSLCKFKIERQTPDFPLYVHVPVQNRGSQELFLSVYLIYNSQE